MFITFEAVPCRDTIGISGASGCGRIGSCDAMYAMRGRLSTRCQWANIIYRCQHKLFNRCPNRVRTRQPFSIELKNSERSDTCGYSRNADFVGAKFNSMEWKSQWTVNSCNSTKSNIWSSGKSARKILTMCYMCTGVVWMQMRSS